MTRHQSRIEYGDSLRIQPQLSKIMDRAVVKFVNAHNRERDDMKGFDDPLFHLPKPEEPTLKVHSVKELLVQVSDAPVLAPKMYACRRWHGADWWMVLSEDIEEVPVGCTVTRRVTVLPDSTEPDTLDFLPDLVVTRGGARFILPERKLNGQEFRQQVSLFRTLPIPDVRGFRQRPPGREDYRSLVQGMGVHFPVRPRRRDRVCLFVSYAALAGISRTAPYTSRPS